MSDAKDYKSVIEKLKSDIKTGNKIILSKDKEISRLELKNKNLEELFKSNKTDNKNLKEEKKKLQAERLKLEKRLAAAKIDKKVTTQDKTTITNMCTNQDKATITSEFTTQDKTSNTTMCTNKDSQANFPSSNVRTLNDPKIIINDVNSNTNNNDISSYKLEQAKCDEKSSKHLENFFEEFIERVRLDHIKLREDILGKKETEFEN